MIKCNTIKCKYNKNGYCTKEWNIKVDISDHPSKGVRVSKDGSNNLRYRAWK